MMWIFLIACLFLAAGVMFLLGKGGFLIAGFNTANKDEKAKYDEKKLNRCFAIFCIGIGCVLCLTGYVDTEKFAVEFMLPAILALLLFLFIATGKYCKKK